jgi:hypothetical protein
MARHIDDANTETLGIYVELISKRGVKPKEDLKNPITLEHALWMALTAQKASKTNNWSTDKVSRWVGFIQAVLISNKLTTIEQERNRVLKQMIG